MGISLKEARESKYWLRLLDKSQMVNYNYNKELKEIDEIVNILTAIVNRWDEIKEVLNKPTPPYVYEFDIKKGIKECHL